MFKHEEDLENDSGAIVNVWNGGILGWSERDEEVVTGLD